VHALLGIALIEQSQTDEAIELFRRAIKLDPEDADAQAVLAGALLQQGRATLEPPPTPGDAR
jgi:Flp pilus assembly protein TadD